MEKPKVNRPVRKNDRPVREVRMRPIWIGTLIPRLQQKELKDAIGFHHIRVDENDE